MKYIPYIINKNMNVIIDPFNISFIPILFNINLQNFKPTRVCTTANDKGIIKNINNCLNKALFISFSSAPICLNTLYLFLSSIQSDNDFKASIAYEDIKNIIPRYNPMNVTIADRPTAASLISNLESLITLYSGV